MEQLPVHRLGHHEPAAADVQWARAIRLGLRHDGDRRQDGPLRTGRRRPLRESGLHAERLADQPGRGRRHQRAGRLATQTTRATSRSIITDDTAFTGSGNEPIPIRYFAGFYVTGLGHRRRKNGARTRRPGRSWQRTSPRLGDFLSTEPRQRRVWGHFIDHRRVHRRAPIPRARSGLQRRARGLRRRAVEWIRMTSSNPPF